MSAINISNQIPNNIVTMEQIFVWSGLALQFMNPQHKIVETEAGGVNAMQSGMFTAFDGSERIFIRGSIALNPAYKVDRTQKLWMFAEEFGQIVVPTGFTTN